MTPEPLGDLEALIWGLDERSPEQRAVITVVALLDRSPGIDHLRRRAVILADHLPRLRARIDPGPTALAGPRWVPDADFDPVWHARLVGAPEPTGLEGVLRMVEPLATEGMDRHRPPWQMTLVEGIDPDGGAALVIRMHHVLTDGVGAVAMAAVLFDLAPNAPAAPAPDASRPGHRAPEPVTWDDVRGALADPVSGLRSRLPLLAGHARDALLDPVPRAQETVDLLRSVGRLADPTARPLSPLMTGRSLAARMGVIDLDLGGMVAAGRRAGGTVNDVFVAGLLDGLRRYHAAHGLRPRSLRVGVPVNLRDESTAEEPNAFAPGRVIAPLQITDASSRIAAVHRLVLRERHQPAHQLTGPLAGLVRRLPGGRAAMGAVMSGFDVLASNVPGPPVPLWLGQAAVTALYPFGPRNGAGLNVTLLSHDGVARLGVHLDPAATPDRKVLLDCLDEGFAATLG